MPSIAEPPPTDSGTYREQIAREVEAQFLGAECGEYEMTRDPEWAAEMAAKGVPMQPHYPDKGWSYCEGCSSAQSSDDTVRAIVAAIRKEG